MNNKAQCSSMQPHKIAAVDIAKHFNRIFTPWAYETSFHSKVSHFLTQAPIMHLIICCIRMSTNTMQFCSCE